MKHIGLAALLLLSGCVTTKEANRRVAEQRVKDVQEMEFNLNVQQSLLSQQCSAIIDQVEIQYSILFCTVDRSKFKDKCAAIVKKYGKPELKAKPGGARGVDLSNGYNSGKPR